MRGSISACVVLVVAGWLVVACGSEPRAPFKCKSTAIANGQSTQCEGSNPFEGTSPDYTCVPVRSVTMKTLSPLAGELGTASEPCPEGTTVELAKTNPIGAAGWIEGSSSGGSSSGGSSSGGSSSGESSGNDAGTTSSGGSSSGESPTTSSSSSSSGSSGSEPGDGSCESGYQCTAHGKAATCVCTKCDQGYHAVDGACVSEGNNGVGNGVDAQPPGAPPVNDGPETSRGVPGNKDAD